MGAEKGVALGSPNAQSLGWVVYNGLHSEFGQPPGQIPKPLPYYLHPTSQHANLNNYNCTSNKCLYSHYKQKVEYYR